MEKFDRVEAGQLKVGDRFYIDKTKVVYQITKTENVPHYNIIENGFKSWKFDRALPPDKIVVFMRSAC